MFKVSFLNRLNFKLARMQMMYLQSIVMKIIFSWNLNSRWKSIFSFSRSFRMKFNLWKLNLSLVQFWPSQFACNTYLQNRRKCKHGLTSGQKNVPFGTNRCGNLSKLSDFSSIIASYFLLHDLNILRSSEKMGHSLWLNDKNFLKIKKNSNFSKFSIHVYKPYITPIH